MTTAVHHLVFCFLEWKVLPKLSGLKLSLQDVFGKSSLSGRRPSIQGSRNCVHAFVCGMFIFHCFLLKLFYTFVSVLNIYDRSAVCKNVVAAADLTQFIRWVISAELNLRLVLNNIFKLKWIMWFCFCMHPDCVLSTCEPRHMQICQMNTTVLEIVSLFFYSEINKTHQLHNSLTELLLMHHF